MASIPPTHPLNDLKVECYCGYRGEETPRRFWIGTRPVDVCQVLDRWLAPRHRYFKVLGDDGGQYILRHDPYGYRWTLVFFKASTSSESDGSGL
jgi:hypothetical protein